MVDIVSELKLEPLIKKTVLLRPHRSLKELPFTVSKMGGCPNLSGFETWPGCEVCSTPMNFVIQLYKKDFLDFYWPDDKNLFQIFRCPNYNCSNNFNESYDLFTKGYFHNTGATENKNFQKPLSELTDLESEVPDCYFKMTTAIDYPHFELIPLFEAFNLKYGESEVEELFWSEFQPRSGTKFNGYPSWTQNPDTPKCSCGKLKDFIFQLSSEDMEDGQEWPPEPDKWSPHGIMIGDVGNIYFFVCRDCGEKSLETKWDCG
ncbi:MAG: DUF1963 domain-containing protein [Cyclobacteriaceae bacterium]